MNDQMEIRMVPVGDLTPHPENRKVVTRGTEWKEFLESVRTHGVVNPLLVRPVQGGLQIVAGERRWRAAMAAEWDRVPVQVREMTEQEAVEFLLLENLKRLDLRPMEEARGVAALARVSGLTPLEVARRISHSVDWVQLRLALPTLPKAGQKALDSGRLQLGAAAAVLRAPEEERERALQLVLEPELQTDPLSARQAEEVVESCIVAPARRKAEWMAKREKWAKKVRADVHERCAGVNVLVATWEEACKMEAQGARWALALEPLGRHEMTEAARKLDGEVLWATVALRHGAAVVVTTAEDDGDEPAEAVVDLEMLWAAEESLAERLRKLGRDLQARTSMDKVEALRQVMDEAAPEDLPWLARTGLDAAALRQAPAPRRREEPQVDPDERTQPAAPPEMTVPRALSVADSGEGEKAELVAALRVLAATVREYRQEFGEVGRDEESE